MAQLKDTLINGDLRVTGKSYLEYIESPALTGTPTAPTAAAGTNNTQIATTGFVASAMESKADKVSGSNLNGKLVALDANGNLMNSTLSAYDVSTAMNAVVGKQEAMSYTQIPSTNNTWYYVMMPSNTPSNDAPVEDTDIGFTGNLKYQPSTEKMTCNITGSSSSANGLKVYSGYMDLIAANDEKYFNEVIIDELPDKGYCHGVLTLFVRTSTNAYGSYHVSFVVYRDGNNYYGKVSTAIISISDSALTVTHTIVKQYNTAKIYVFAKVASSAARYTNCEVSATLLDSIAYVPTSNNVGNNIESIAGSNYTTIN